MSASEVRIVDPTTGGEKGQKLERFDLFPFDALEELARVYGKGAAKYADDNWLRGYRWRLSLGAMLRHVARFAVGEHRDPETGCLHLAHAAWHCLTLITFYLRGLGTNDLAPPKKADDLDELHPDEPIPFEVVPLPPLVSPDEDRPLSEEDLEELPDIMLTAEAERLGLYREG